MNIYSSTPFLEAFNKAYFPEVQLHLEDFVLQGQIWRLPTFPDGKPITEWQLIDFFEPVAPSEVKTTSKNVSYITKVCHGVVTAKEWFDRNLFVPYEASPSIHWTSFSSWEEFLAHLKSNNSKLYRDSQRRKRKLEKDVGPVKFVWHDTRPEAFDFCMELKAAQFNEAQELFADATNVCLFQELINTGLLVVSSLSVGDKFLAVDLGGIWDGRFYSWVAAYDPQYSTYAPGRLLMHFTMETSYQQGHKEFDLLIGGESYKWDYATHSRMISEIGGLSSSIKTLVKKQLSYAPIKELKKIKQNLYRLPEFAKNGREL